MTTKNNTGANLPALQPQNTAPTSTPSERFTQMVVKEYMANAGDLELSTFQKRLIQNYFIKLDQSLKENESKRLSVKEQYRDGLEFIWDNINMNKLATDVVAYSCVGLDPLQNNHINLIAYKNGKTSKFDIGFLIGYKGCELKAKKYGYEVPDDVIIELVYSNDIFKSIKKNVDNKIASYQFESVDDFDRGEIRGGFYYHVYFDRPEKNKLVTFSLKDIEKRKPKKASAEFWGGEKDVWENGKKTGTETLEGWFDEMAWKTIARAAYNDITIDSEKIDQHFHRMIAVDNERRAVLVEEEVKEDIKTNANKTVMNFDEDATILGNDENASETPTATDDQKSTGKLFDKSGQESEIGPGY